MDAITLEDINAFHKINGDISHESNRSPSQL